MIKVRKAEERGHFKTDWLSSHHTFSFGDYYDPKQMGFRQLRVINEDRVQPGGGFPMHPHRDMEIITLVLAGALRHEDSAGNSEVIGAGDVQLISAGTGIRHSEYNPSDTDEVHFLQIWIHPEKESLEPGYQFASFDLNGRPDSLIALASPDGGEGAVAIRQDATLSYLALTRGGRLEHTAGDGRHLWVQLTDGVVDVNGRTLRAGDGAAVSDEREIVFASAAGGALLLFDLA